MIKKILTSNIVLVGLFIIGLIGIEFCTNKSIESDIDLDLYHQYNPEDWADNVFGGNAVKRAMFAKYYHHNTDLLVNLNLATVDTMIGNTIYYTYKDCPVSEKAMDCTVIKDSVVIPPVEE